jgi:cysteine-rich repeat protein
MTCWGRDLEGQRAPLLDPEFAAGFQVLAAGGNYTCGIRLDGQPVCFGQGEPDWTEFGLESPGLAHGLAAGDNDACVIRPDFSAYCTRDAIDVSTAVVTVLAAGRSHVCGLGLDGATACWGSNGAGQTIVPGFAATAPPVCGNGRLDEAGGETCDDRNAVDGDGCDNQCQLGEP